MDVQVVNAPVGFPGTPEERAANYATHNFSGDEDGRCFGCDCKPWHVTASYPCGTEPPRAVVPETTYQAAVLSGPATAPRTLFDLPIAAWAMQDDYAAQDYYDNHEREEW